MQEIRSRWYVIENDDDYDDNDDDDNVDDDNVDDDDDDDDDHHHYSCNSVNVKVRISRFSMEVYFDNI